MLSSWWYLFFFSLAKWLLSGCLIMGATTVLPAIQNLHFSSENITVEVVGRWVDFNRMVTWMTLTVKLILLFWSHNFIICIEILTIFHCVFNRYFVITAVPSWPDFLTWISRLAEFVCHVHKLLEKVICCYFLFDIKILPVILSSSCTQAIG